MGQDASGMYAQRMIECVTKWIKEYTENPLCNWERKSVDTCTMCVGVLLEKSGEERETRKNPKQVSVRAWHAKCKEQSRE